MEEGVPDFLHEFTLTVGQYNSSLTRCGDHVINGVGELQCI